MKTGRALSWLLVCAAILLPLSGCLGRADTSGNGTKGDTMAYESETVGGLTETEPPEEETVKEGSVFSLSRTGMNVVIIMLDRAMNEYIPYIFKEKPELSDQFDGFTYYSNVISFGGYTNFGVPPLYGGYEYTPVEMNKREDELL